MPDEEESGVMAFCDAMETIEQPDVNRTRECPPEKGFAMIAVHTWVPEFMPEVSLLQG